MADQGNVGTGCAGVEFACELITRVNRESPFADLRVAQGFQVSVVPALMG